MFKKLCFATLFLSSTFVAADTSPFDVTYAQYISGITHQDGLSNPYGSIDSKAYISSNLYAYMQSMERYAEEMEEGVLAMEYYEGLGRATELNADLTDYRAYAVIGYFDLDFSTQEGFYDVFYHGDVISGSDWNNDGYIDLFVGAKGLRYYNAALRQQ